MDTMVKRVCLEYLAFERSMRTWRRPVEGLQIEVDDETVQAGGVKDKAMVIWKEAATCKYWVG